MKNYLKNLLVSFSIFIYSNVSFSQGLTLDEMPRWEVCVHASQLGFLLAQIIIYQNKEPQISASREPTEYEAKVIKEVMNRVKYLISIENYYNPDHVRRTILNECLKENPLWQKV